MTDIDGTITCGGGLIDVEAVKYIRLLEKHGVKVILASGNAYPVVIGLKEYLGASPPVIAENGGVIGQEGGFRVLGNNGRAKEALNLILKRFSDEVYGSWQNQFRFSDFALYVKGGDRGEIVKAIRRYLREEDFKDVEVVDSKVALHVHTVGVSKGNALKQVLNLNEGRSFKLVAVGDSEVDISMFKVADFKVALSNASEVLKSLADYVTRGEEGKGFVEMAKLLLERKLF